MKKLLFISIIALGFAACNQSTSGSGDKKDTTSSKMEGDKMASKDKIYGVAFDYKAPVKLTDLMKDAANLDTTKDYAVEAVVTSVCQSKGCWFRAEDGKGGDVFIKIVGEEKGEELGIPMNTAAGSSLIFYGTPKYREISVKQQRHYLEDAGKSKAEIDAITKPKMEWRFFASGVVVKG